ncbi:AraC family transcriptional regulator [Dechloromonas agitata]|uniref:cupin domain-containing protein n=1 Tax=Dechloromonas agitata TaxID=73030 RepID=UPI00237E3BE1|nr:AraC family transcriptional regulator [Dechloromonas agitata]MDE1546185.1 AraC family transcriptional regulator [Dechloromonas agitata]
MASLAFDDYRAQALSEGYDEVLVRSWPADLQIDTHTHAFALKARVVQGEMWLTVDDETRRLQPGDEFSLEYAVPHAERYGHQGATYWLARRNQPD